METIGTCIYCGQNQIIDLEEGERPDKATLDYRATMSCDCEEAQEAQVREEAMKDAEARIQELFGTDFPEGGKLLSGVLEKIMDGTFRSLTVENRSGIKGKIGATPKGSIKVERTDTKKAAMEI